MAERSNPGPPADPLDAALEREDARALAASATKDDLDRMKAAEELLELRHKRAQRRSRISIATQSVVGFVAIAGFFVNAFQSYQNKSLQQEQRKIDQDRWSKEFARASQADKYRAFFETSVLSTDPANADKRLVGYALLQEFVQDRDYTQKAMLMLEESLSQELRSNTNQGLDEEHRAAVVAILTALSQTTDCRALERAARSVDRIARRHAEVQDAEETTEVLKVYVRRVLGRGADVCTSFKDFRAVRRPIRDTVMKHPALLRLAARPSAADANTRLAETLRDRCADEIAVSGASECPDAIRGYAELCAKASASDLKEDAAGCALMKAAAAELKPQAPAGAEPRAAGPP
jgi:hypothetical protein